MPVGQPVLDTHYKNIKKNNANVNLDKTTVILTVIIKAVIIAQRRNSHKSGHAENPPCQ